MEIKNIIYDFFSKKTSPTLEDIMKKIRLRQVNVSYKSIFTLRNLIIKLGFSYKMLNLRIHIT